MSRIHATAIVDPTAKLADDVTVGPYAIIGADVVLADGVSVGAHAVLTGPMSIGAGTRVFPHATLGGEPQDLKYAGEVTRTEIGARNVFGSSPP